MRRDIQLLVPLVLFGLSFLAVVMGLLLLTGLKWDAVLEDVGLIEPTEIGVNVPLSTPDPETLLSEDFTIKSPVPTAYRANAIAPAPTLTPTLDPSATAAALERKPHFPSMRTGVEDIDRVIDLVLGVDDNAIRDALIFTLAGCTHAEGLGGPPKCREGEEEGDQVEVLPILGSEGHFYRKDEIVDWRGIGAVGTYAAYEVWQGRMSDESYPTGEYAAMFMESDHQFLVLQILNGGVVRIDYVLGEEPEAKIEREARRVILAPLPHGVIPSTGLGLTIPGWTLSQLTPTSSPGDIWLTPTPEYHGPEKTEPPDYATPSAPSPTHVPSDSTEYPTPTAVSETAEPSAVPTVSYTPLPTTLCDDRVAFVADVSLPDGALIKPGEQFRKTWSLRNTGTCTWTEGYSLAFHSGDSMGTYASQPLGVKVSPGQAINLSIDLTAPLLHGRYKSYWMLRNSDGFHFGFGPGSNRPFWVDIVVGSMANPRCNVSEIPVEPPTSTLGMGVDTVAISGSYAFATTSKGFSVFDVSDSANPTQVNTLRQAWGKVVDLVLRDKYAYVGSGFLSVFDISNPEAPFLAGEFFVGGKPQNMAVAGNFAYVLDFESGLHVIDITDPSQPSEIGHSAPIESARGLAVHANYAFVGGRETRAGRGYGFLKVFDLTNPTSPREVGSLEDLGIGVVDVVVSGDKALVSVKVDGYDYDFWVLDVSDPSAPVSLGSFEGTQIIWDMVVSGACAFMINFEAEGFMVLDVSNPYELREIGVMDLFGFSNRLAIEGGIVYIADRDEGLLLYRMIPPN